MRFMVCIEVTTNRDRLSRTELLVKLGKALDRSTARKALSETMGCEIRLQTAEDAVSGFFESIESTGGVTKHKQGWYVPVADRAWIDLGEAYVEACAAFGKEPMVASGEAIDDEAELDTAVEEDRDCRRGLYGPEYPGENF